VISAKVAALTEGVVKTMCVAKIKNVLAIALVVAALSGAVGLIYKAPAGEQLQAKADHIGKADKTKDAGQQSAQPKQQLAKTDEELMLGNWFIVNDDSLRKGEMWVISKDQILMDAKKLGLVVIYFYRLDTSKTPKQIDLTVTAKGAPIIKGIYALDGDELRLCFSIMGKDRPTEFASKPGAAEFLILHRLGKAKLDLPPAKNEEKQGMTKEEKLKLLIDQVLTAHGGEDKLNKLQFTMTVKHSNGYTNEFFVQQPNHYRWEYQHRDSKIKEICILLPNGRMWWRKHPNGDLQPVIYTGAEPTMAYWLDHVKFFGPRKVLRLKDADHKVTLLDEEIKIDGRAAVGVGISGPVKGKMYFDKETHLLTKLEGCGFYHQPIYYSDYKTFDGIPIAQREKDGYFNSIVTDFRVVDKFDAKLFEQP
jgi:uncharacterized protein (TIGR03067 family)